MEVGGQTSCLAVLPASEASRWLVLDAGTGFRNLAGMLGDQPIRGDVLLTQTLEGDLRVAKVSADDYTELAKWKVSERGTYAHPALVGCRLFVKGPEKFMCYELR